MLTPSGGVAFEFMDVSSVECYGFFSVKISNSEMRGPQNFIFDFLKMPNLFSILLTLAL